jgi:DNA end-binding protein Ku
MRSIWKGSVSFGLVSIGVKLYSATEERDVSFHQVRRSDGSRIRYKRVAEVDGEEVAYADIAKGYSLDNGEVVVLTDEDFADLPLTTSRTIDVLEFVEQAEVDPIYFEKTYYLEPEKTGVRPYVLLRDALEESGRVAVVKVALRSREALATLRVRGGVFVLETMLWPDEVREPEFAFLDEEVEVRPQELAMAASLIDTLAGTFDPSQYTDVYREAIESLIEAKVAGEEVVAPADAAPTSGTVVDLMAALRASVDAARAGRTGTAASAEPAVPAAEPAKKSAKAPAKATAKAPAKATGKAPGKAPAKAAAKAPAKKALADKAPAKKATRRSA